MEVGDLYNVVLLLVITGMLLGVGILALDKFSSSSGVTATSAAIINSTRDAIGEIATSWMSLIVTIIVLAIIITLVIRSFAGKRR